jgi:hypothetical protein
MSGSSKRKFGSIIVLYMYKTLEHDKCRRLHFKWSRTVWSIEAYIFWSHYYYACINMILSPCKFLICSSTNIRFSKRNSVPQLKWRSSSEKNGPITGMFRGRRLHKKVQSSLYRNYCAEIMVSTMWILRAIYVYKVSTL